MMRKPLCLVVVIAALLSCWLTQAVPCSANCAACNRKTGKCSFCPGDNWWGPTCLNRCPDNCEHGQCDIKTGQCVSGCSQHGWWGPTCLHRCPENCEHGQCDMQTGQCTSGCSQHGWWGPTCLHKCPENCEHGQCDIQTGQCVAGCSNHGWWGTTCSKKCLKNCEQCDMKTGRCPELSGGFMQ